MVHIRLDADIHRRLRLVVAAEDTSVQDWVVRTTEKVFGKSWPKVDKAQA